MTKQPNTDRGNRAKARRRKRESARVPGAGAGQPVPIRSPEGQPSVTSLADLAKAGGGQVPLSIPQLMAKVGALTVERDFWMNAAVTLEDQVNALTGGVTAPSVADVTAAETEEEDDEEEELQDIPGEVPKCPGCSVTLDPEAVHADGCEGEGHSFDPEDEPEEETGARVPSDQPASLLTAEEQAVVDEANRIKALQREPQLQGTHEGEPKESEEEAPE